MRQGRLSRRQRLILVLMALTLLAVLGALGSFVRRSASTSPLSTAVLSFAQTTPAPKATALSSPLEPVQAAPTPTQPREAAEVLAARWIMALSKDVGQIRGLPKQQEIPLNFLSAQELASYLRGIRADSERRAFVERQQALLAALGLAPQEDEAFPPTVQTRARQIIAFYDPAEDQIFVGPAGWEDELQDLSLVHQYAHALIDQHFDLMALSEGASNADTIRARDALIEGDAMAVLALHSYGGVDQADLDELGHHLAEVEITDYEGYSSLRALDEVFVFPYREGAHFVGTLLAAGWWPTVNAAYLDPPVSTEQILHPEKYLSSPRDMPRRVFLPDLREDLEGWQLVTQDVVGELVLRAHLDHYLPDTPEAVAAAAGWDGDLAAVWRDLDGRDVLVMRILWDDPDETAEFVQSYAKVIDRRLAAARRVMRSILPPGGRWWRGEEENAYLYQEDDSVLVVWAPDTETMERVLAVFVFGDQ